MEGSLFGRQNRPRGVDCCGRGATHLSEYELHHMFPIHPDHSRAGGSAEWPGKEYRKMYYGGMMSKKVGIHPLVYFFWIGNFSMAWLSFSSSFTYSPIYENPLSPVWKKPATPPPPLEEALRPVWFVCAHHLFDPEYARGVVGPTRMCGPMSSPLRWPLGLCGYTWAGPTLLGGGPPPTLHTSYQRGGGGKDKYK